MGHLRLPLLSLLIDLGFVIVHAHVSKLNIENPMALTAFIRRTLIAPTAMAAAKWIKMVDCVRSRAGDALGVGG